MCVCVCVCVCVCIRHSRPVWAVTPGGMGTGTMKDRTANWTRETFEDIDEDPLGPSFRSQ